MNQSTLPQWLQRNFTRITALLLVIFHFAQAKLPNISAVRRPIWPVDSTSPSKVEVAAEVPRAVGLAS